MSTFIWTYLIIRSIGILAKLVCLGAGRTPKALTLGGMATAVFVDIGFVAWAAYLLVKS